MPGAASWRRHPALCHRRASRNRLLVRKELHPLCNICCWKPCARFTRHRARSTVSVNSQPSNPMICRSLQRQRRSTARARWQHTSLWVSSLLNRIVFFVIPVMAAMIPVIGFALSFYRWLHIRRVRRSYRALGKRWRTGTQMGVLSFLSGGDRRWQRPLNKTRWFDLGDNKPWREHWWASRNVGRLRTVSHLALIGFRPPLGS